MRNLVSGRRWLPAGGFALLLALAACQPLPHPLADDAPAPDAPIMTLKDSAGIVVQPIKLHRRPGPLAHFSA